MSEKRVYVPYDVVKDHLKPKKGHEQETFFNIDEEILVDLEDNPIETIALTPEEAEQFRITPEEG